MHTRVERRRCLPVLLRAPRTAVPLGLRRALRVPRRQGKLRPPTVTEEPAGSSHSVLVITPPVCPCLCLKMQQVLMGTSFFFF